MAEPTQPQDRKTSAAEQRKLDAKQQKAIAEFMSTGVDFTPFTIDVGDGIEWRFKPDMMPADTERLRQAGLAVQAATNGEGGSLVDAYDAMTKAIRDALLDADQRKKFPLPAYGTRALSFFALHLQAGRSGFPTE